VLFWLQKESLKTKSFGTLGAGVVAIGDEYSQGPGVGRQTFCRERSLANVYDGSLKHMNAAKVCAPELRFEDADMFVIACF
jgi:hypothetical protein